MKRAAKFVLVGLVTWLVVALAFVLIYNASDEVLTPEAKTLLEPIPVAGKAENNAYFVILGITAEPDKDPLAVGHTLDSLYFETFSKTPTASTPPTVPVEGKTVSFNGSGELDCDWLKRDCLAYYVSIKQAINRLKQDNAVLVSRYQRVVSLPEYHDRPALSAYEPVPNFNKTYAQLHRLELAGAVLLCDEGKFAEALGAVAASIQTERRILANSYSHIMKVGAARLLNADLGLINALLEKYPAIIPAFRARFQNVLDPLAQAEMTAEQVVLAENKSLARTLLQTDSIASLFGIDALPEWLLNHLWKRNATINLLAKTTFSNGDARKLIWSSYAENPVGRYVLDANRNPEFLTDRARQFVNLDGYVRLTALHALIRTEQTPDADIPAVLEKYGDAGKAISWDGNNRILSVAVQTDFFKVQLIRN